MSSKLDPNRKHSIYTLMKDVRNNIETEQKRTRKDEIAELTEESRKFKPNKESYLRSYRNRYFHDAEKKGVTKQELKACGIDVLRLSRPNDINRAVNGIMKVHEGTLKFRDIGLFLNDALTSEQQTVLYKAVMHAAGDRGKLEQLEYIAKPKYTAVEMSIAADMIKKGCSQDRIDALFAVTELKGVKEFNVDQKDLIQDAFNLGLTKRQIMRIAKQELSEGQMREIFNGYKVSLSEKQIALFASPQFNKTQMKVIRHGLMKGIFVEDMKKIAKPCFSAPVMQAKIDKILERNKGREIPVRQRLKANEKTLGKEDNRKVVHIQKGFEQSRSVME